MQLSALESLDLQEDYFQGTLPIFNLPSLQVLQLDGNAHLSGTIPPLGSMQLLNTLKVCICGLVFVIQKEKR